MDKIKAKLVIALLKLLALLSLPQAQRLGRVIGRVLWWGDSSLVRVTRKNIELCFPEKPVAEQQKMIQASLAETGKVFAELGVMWEWPSDKTLQQIKAVKGKEHFDALAAQNKGIIVLAPHHGNWELVGLYLSTLRPMAALYKPPKLKPLEDYMSAVRGRYGSELVPTNKRGVIRLFSILNNQGMVGILPDQVPGGSGGLFSPFMGVPANTIKLVSRLVHKTGCGVVSLCAMRLPNGEGFELIFRPVDDDIYSEDMQTSVDAMNRAIEACVHDRPEQYQWEYKRFKDYRVGSKQTYG